MIVFLKKMLMLVAIIQPLTLSLYGLTTAELEVNSLDFISMACCFVLFGEVICRILVFGFSHYFNCNQYPPIRRRADKRQAPRSRYHTHTHTHFMRVFWCAVLSCNYSKFVAKNETKIKTKNVC